MKRSLNGTFVLGLCFLFFLPLVAAHGDETSSGLANYQILAIALGISLLAYIVAMKKFSAKMHVFSPLLFSLAIFTGIVHILLGLSDRLLLLGGVGVLGVLLLPIVLSMDERKSNLVRIGLSLVAISMFVGYFVSNHDLHYILEDYLGITTKISEIALLIGVYRSRRMNNEDE